MYQIKRSALFKRYALQYVLDYQERAGSHIAEKFIDGLEHSIAFIQKHPTACGVYHHIGGHDFRRWQIKGFPHSIYFRLDKQVVILEAIYAHKMNIDTRLPSDMDQSS